MSGASACRGCGAPILWVQSKNRANLPLDVKTAPNGNVRISGDGETGHVLSGVALHDSRAVGEKLHLSHFVTCPDRDRWRIR